MAKYTIDNLPIVKGKYKVIALDLDDTLLRSDKSISENTIKTLQKAQSQGFSIAIATGRHPKSAVLYMQKLGCLMRTLMLYASMEQELCVCQTM